MEFTTIISLISMIATVISTIFAFKAKNEALKTKNEIIQIRNDFSSVDTTSSIINHGTNSGVRAGTVNGGVSFNGK
ncbi:hypothetical protein MKY37_16545 [Psychrobacillus sp. FSL K6-2836]|uniref:hypothetical protein n=1 Tax=Psychrobacillus sp. FSL K6-2836 TaxID=2921548 RepID=UPI0030F9BEF9